MPTTQMVTTTTPALVKNLTASSLMKNYVCKGNELTISIPTDFNLFPINYYYGVTSDLTCSTIRPQDCKSPAPFTCKTQINCKISFTTAIQVADCGGNIANYIGIEYRFIPCKK